MMNMPHVVIVPWYTLIGSFHNVQYLISWLLLSMKIVINLQITPLQCIDVCVNDVQCKGLIDSGARITVLSQKEFDKLKTDVCGYNNNI